MITESQIYWITRLDSIKEAIQVTGAILLLITICWLAIAMLATYATYDYAKDDEKRILARKHIKISIFAFVVSSLIAFGSCFIPTTKEYCAIKILPKIINNEDVQKLPDKVVDLANEWLDELRPKKEEK